MLSNLYAQKMRIPKGGFSKTLTITTADTTGDIASVKDSTLRFNVQHVKVTVLTGSAGKTLVLESATVPLTHALDMATAGAVYDFDFGPKGIAFAVNETLDATISSAGAAAKVVFDGYYST